MSKVWLPGYARAGQEHQRAPMPSGQVRLSDGRFLKREPRLDIAFRDKHGVKVNVWMSRKDRLRVIAEHVSHQPKPRIETASASGVLIPVAGGDPIELLRVTISYEIQEVDAATVQCVRDAFFPKAIEVIRFFAAQRSDSVVHLIQTTPDLDIEGSVIE